jgi:hypothetical protein
VSTQRVTTVQNEGCPLLLVHFVHSHVASGTFVSRKGRDSALWHVHWPAVTVCLLGTRGRQLKGPHARVAMCHGVTVSLTGCQRRAAGGQQPVAVQASSQRAVIRPP